MVDEKKNKKSSTSVKREWRDPAAENYSVGEEERKTLPDLGELVSEMITIHIRNPRVTDKRYHGEDRKRYDELKTLVASIGYDASDRESRFR